MIRKGVTVAFADYCKDRKEPTQNEFMLYLEEVNQLCPLCGKAFLYQTEKSIVKGCEIAHIFPNRPTLREKEILKDVEVLGDDSESYENKIALCYDCHTKYDANKTVESYNEMLELKRRLYTELRAKKEISGENIEKELTIVVEHLSEVSDEDLEEVGKLSYDSLKVSQKVEIVPLRRRIEADVTSFYPYCRQCFKEIDGTGTRFNIICLLVKKSYMKLKSEGLDKEKIFEQMTDWLISKTHASRVACGIILSFFVQNCDVYDEIPE